MLEVTPGLADQKLNCFWATLPRAMLFLAGFAPCRPAIWALHDEVSGGAGAGPRVFVKVRRRKAYVETPAARKPAKLPPKITQNPTPSPELAA